MNGTIDDKYTALDGLIWKDGIGTLPGSDFRFRIVDGEIEMINDDVDNSEEDGDKKEEPTNFDNETEEEKNSSTGEPINGDKIAVESKNETNLTTNGDNIELEKADKSMQDEEAITVENELNIKNLEETTANHEINVEDVEKEDVPINGTEEVLEDGNGRCVMCGHVGKSNKFFGKFCSRTCVGRNAIRYRGTKKSESKNDSNNSEINLPMVIPEAADKGKRNDLKIKIRLPSSPDDSNLHLTPQNVGKRRISSQATPNSDKTEKKKRKFIWSQYLEAEKADAVPVSAFEKSLRRPAFPKSSNEFQRGMALEGVDITHQSLICCLSVAEVRGHRIRLHFEGYSELYDFWTNADSPYLFSCGFCKKTGRKLTVPRGYTDESFSWTNHMKKYKLFPTPKELLQQNEMQDKDNLFKIGNKLEAVDKQNPDLTCVATVTDVISQNILVHFDGWAHDFDYWCHIQSCYIHPVGWCQINEKLLSPPEGYPDISNFTWEKYLVETNAKAVPENAFKVIDSHEFKRGMKLEAVDKRNPVLVRVATITEVEGFRIKIHFDGWNDMYDCWFDVDCDDIHPVGWSAKTGHALQPPILPEDLVQVPGQGGCPIPGCNGIGHVKGAKFTGHYSEFGCPYSPQNLDRDNVPDRLVNSKNSSRNSNQSLALSPKHESKRKHSVGHDDESDPDYFEKEPKTKRRSIMKQNLSMGVGNRRKRSSTYQPSSPKDRKIVVPSNRINDLVDENGQSFYSSKHHSVFVSALTSYPSYDLPLCWDQHIKLLPDLKKTSVSEVSKWSRDEVAEFVENLTGKPEHGKIFAEQEIDGESMLLLTQGDIAKIMKIKLGPAVKIYSAILMLKSAQHLPV